MNSRAPLIALATALALTAAACGDDDSGPATAGQDYEQRAAAICKDGTQEAVALPLPSSRGEIAADAAARAEIVGTVRDGLLALGVPDGREAEAGALLDEFAADIEQLGEITAAAEAGDLERAQQLAVAIDESSGQAALELGLRDCAAFSNAIARTP